MRAEQGTALGKPSVQASRADQTAAIVIITYNHTHFLAEAIESVLTQTRPFDEIIVVDDGSTDDPGSMVARYPEVNLIQQPNQGPAAARNAGLVAASADTIAFLDADDRLLANALEAGLACHARVSYCGFVYGGYRCIERDGQPIGEDYYKAVGPNAYWEFLQGNLVGMHAAVLYRRDRLLEIGGFDAALRWSDDYDVYLRMAHAFPVASHPVVVAEYRKHGENRSEKRLKSLKSVLKAHRKQAAAAGASPETAAAWQQGQSAWRRYYAAEIIAAAAHDWRRRRRFAAALSGVGGLVLTSPRLAASAAARAGWRHLGRVLPVFVVRRLHHLAGRGQPPPLRTVDFGDFRRPAPICGNFGYSRGTPVDRYYIEAFLVRHAADVAGRVLEVGDDAYTRRFGGSRVTQRDVLHVHPGNPQATIVGDLSAPGLLPLGAFDCLLVTQTLHLIYDMRAAVEEMHRALKPGGVLLLTVPGISPVDRSEWGRTWLWSLTPASVRRLCAEAFGPDEVDVESHGNAFAATAFLQGVAQEEVDRTKLDVRDEAYPVVVAVRARRAAD